MTHRWAALLALLVLDGRQNGAEMRLRDIAPVPCVVSKSHRPFTQPALGSRNQGGQIVWPAFKNNGRASSETLRQAQDYLSRGEGLLHSARYEEAIDAARAGVMPLGEDYEAPDANRIVFDDTSFGMMNAEALVDAGCLAQGATRLVEMLRERIDMARIPDKGRR